MIVRTYACDDCGSEFEVTCNSDDPAPDCPNCARVLEWRPGMFAIKTTKSRAMDVTQDILEKDFGLTNFKDNQREGDVAAITAPAPSQAAKDAEIRQLSEVVQQTTGQPLTAQQHAMAQSFWGGGNAMQQAIPADAMLAGAKQNTAAADAEGVNPMALLHKAGKAGHLKTPIKIVARAR
jgi:hypothetical protein